MNNKQLEYYNRELEYLREMGKEFAQQYPKVAGRLGMNATDIRDPYVERLLEGVAFLTSRVQLKMDAEFPRLSQKILDMLAPNYTSPTPSMAIAELKPDVRKGDLSRGFIVPRGTMIESQSLRKNGITCGYSTAHDVNLLPLEITQVELSGIPADLPVEYLKTGINEIASTLRIQFSVDGELRLKNLSFNHIDLFLNGPDILAHKLLELIMEHKVSIAYRFPDEMANFIFLDEGEIRHEGFSQEQAMLPCDLRNFDAYRLLHEYFSFPGRFLFLSINGMKQVFKKCGERKSFELFIFLSKKDEQLEKVVDKNHLALNCTPVINLFPKIAARQKLEDSKNEYHIVVDKLKPLDYEIYSVNRILASVDGQKYEQIFRPFWNSNGYDDGNYSAYFTLRREERLLSEHGNRYGSRAQYIGSEIFASIVDEKLSPWRSELRYLTADVLCTNRDLSLVLRHKPDDFTISESFPVKDVNLRRGPTSPSPALAEGPNAWRLVSQLQMNYLSIMDSEDGVGAIRKLLALYSHPENMSTAGQVEGIRHCVLTSVSRRISVPGPITFARGTAITLTVDEQYFSGYSPWLFGSIIECIFSRLAAINSFTEFTLRSQQRGIIGHWPPRTGCRALL